MFAKLSRRRPGHATVVAYLALFVALGGGAYAASSIVGPDGKIHGCYAKRGEAKGALRVVPQGARCRRGERPVAWNQRGRRGETGATGQAGATGQPGPATGPAGGALAGSYPDPGLAPPENWHEVTSFGGCSISPSSTWQNSGGGLATAAYYRDPLGVVHVKGSVVCAGPVNVGYTFFSLPAGYRPEAVRYFTARTSFGASASGVILTSSGNLTTANNLSAGQQVSLDAISFRCAPSGTDGCP